MTTTATTSLSHGWTPERRQRQAEAIHRWRPWLQSTGPTSADGKSRSSANAWRGGERPLLRLLAAALRRIEDDRGAAPEITVLWPDDGAAGGTLVGHICPKSQHNPETA